MCARPVTLWLTHVLRLVAAALLSTGAIAQDVPEYRLKAAFVYNFAAFTEWPSDVGSTLNLCLFGGDPFGAEIDALNQKKVGERKLIVHRKAQLDALKGCQIVFIADADAERVRRVVEAQRGQTMLTVADTPGALQHGVAVNMNLAQARVTFEINRIAARAGRVDFGSNLLRLATAVQQ